MNLTPSEHSKTAGADVPEPSLAETLANKRKRHAAANRRAAANPTNRMYSVMLIASTLVAAGFCMLYITKPVIVTLPEGDLHMPKSILGRKPDPQVDAKADDASKPTPASAAHDGHEETNLRVQHVLNASTADGDLSRIVLDVPVIYASRHLRWTEEEVENAREIHARLANFHKQSRQLRELGASLLDEWNALIERSIPAADLRADSPSLPGNQEEAANMPRPTMLDTTEVIEIKPSEE